MLKKSLTYMFNDNKFTQKAAIYFIFAILLSFCNGIINSNCLIVSGLFRTIMLSLVLYLINSISFGYRIANICVLKNKNAVSVLPTMNLKHNFLSGFKFSIAEMLFFIPCVFIIAGFAFFAGFSSIIHNVQVTKILLIALIISSLLYMLYLALFNIGFINMYSKNPSFTIFFKIKSLLLFIKQNPKKYLISMLCDWLVTIIYMLFSIWTYNLNSLAFIFAVLISSIILTYLFFVINYIIANCLDY